MVDYMEDALDELDRFKEPRDTGESRVWTCLNTILYDGGCANLELVFNDEKFLALWNTDTGKKIDWWSLSVADQKVLIKTMEREWLGESGIRRTCNQPKEQSL